MRPPKFNMWTPWVDRDSIDDRGHPGVYLLGRFEASPPALVDSLAESILYIGETCDPTLAKRWYQFHRSAFRQRFLHSGGSTFSVHFCDNSVSEPPQWLYVAALPVLLDEPHGSAYIRF